MGGCCCCCASRRSEPIRTPTYYYCPRTSEEREPLSAHNGGSSVISPRLLVDTNLDSSVPDTYTPPPAPIPYNVDQGRLSPGGGANYGAKSGLAVETADTTGSVAEPNAVVPLGTPAKVTKDIEIEPTSILELDSSKDSDDDLKKPSETIVTTIEEEDCPICLEEYTEDNPKMVTDCEHHFHLCCILEWMERSDNCPVCDKEVIIDELINS